MTAVRIKWHVLSLRGISWHTNGARAGNRTLNLGFKSLSTPSARESQRGSERLNRTRIHDAAVSGSLRESQGGSESLPEKESNKVRTTQRMVMNVTRPPERPCLAP